MKKAAGLILCVCMLTVLALGCAKEPVPSGGASGSSAAPPSAAASEGTYRPPVEDETGMYVQQPDITDFTYMWLPQGNGGMYQETYMMSGNYGLSVSSGTGGITRFGAFPAPMDYGAAMVEDSSLIRELPAVKMEYSMRYGEENYSFDIVEAMEDSGISTRMLESGRYLQRLDVMCLKTAGNSDWYGRMEVMALPEYFTIAFEVFPQLQTCRDAELQFSLKYASDYVGFEESLNGRAVTVTDIKGMGFTVVAPQGVSIKQEDSALVFTASGLTLYPGGFNGFNIAVIPSASAVPADAERYAAREQLTVSAQRLSPQAGTERKADYSELGYYSFDLNGMFSVREGEYTETQLDTYDRIKFTIDNPTQHTIKVPLQFIKEEPLSVTGLSPMLRDASTLEPIGIQVQITRNWHYYSTDPNGAYTYAAQNSPYRNWEGRWYHGYTVIEVPAGQSVTYEYTCAFARWGGVESVTHSQLCLVGWGGHQQWESASLGSYGESFCYDISRSWTWCVMGDICPFGLYSRVNGEKYNWTTNTGGVDFLLAYDPSGNAIDYRGFKTFFKKQGPNITEVIYRGMLGNDLACLEISAQMGRTDDVSRATQTFRYTFLEDVPYSRMAFYQFGADSYNYDYWDTMAVGNDDGLISFTLAGQTYNGLMEVPKSSQSDYLGGQGMNCAEVPGSGAWFAFLGAPANESKGNKMISVREYRADINGKTYTQPCFSVRTTNVLQWQSAGFELNPPKEAGNLIKAGSTVSFVIEYINLPAHKQDYYGTSSVLEEIPAQDYESWKLAYTYAVQSNVSVQASVGTAVGNLPPVIQAADVSEGTAAQFTITKGIGYVPVTIKNVKGFSGWRLQKKVDGSWQAVDQSVHGNDYWQAWYDSQTGTYELTFNVHHNGKNDVGEYRLVKEKA